MNIRMKLPGISRIFFLVVTLFGIGVVIGVHEFGHLLACKLFNVYAPTYSIGFGPALVQKKIGNTVYQLAPIPLGGYTQVVENPENKMQEVMIHIHGEKFFNEIPYWQKFIILIAGIVFNLIFAWLIIFMLALFPKRREQDAEQAHAEQNMHPALKNPITRVFVVPTLVMGRMVKLFTGIYRRTPENKDVTIGGPILFFSESVKSLQSGFRFFCVYLAGFNISLALFNVLPIPLLDGGRIVMVTIETLVGHQIPEQTKLVIYLFFLFLLILMVTLLSARDIARLARNRSQK